MKRLAFVFAAVFVTAALWGNPAGGDTPVPDPDVYPEQAYFEMQRSPQSILGETGALVHTDIDDFVDVVDYRNLVFNKHFFFLGGSGGITEGSLRGGWAGKIGAGYLGLYFAGDFFYGRGNTADNDKPAYSKFVMNDNLIVLFGNAALGGLRLDLRFDQTRFTSEDTATPFVTTLQWGRQFGMFSPKVSVGMSWGGYGTEDTNAEDPDAEDGASTEDGVPSFNNTKLGIKLEAAYGRFAADYQLSIGLDEKPYSGIDNLLNLYWTAQLSVMEKLTLKARPQLQFDIFGGERMFYFGFAPILEAALHYQITPKIGVVTGVRFDILRVETKKREKGDAWTDDTGSSWQVTPAGAVGGNVAFELSPSEHFTLELGIGGFFDFNESEYKVDFTTITGCLACIFRL